MAEKITFYSHKIDQSFENVAVRTLSNSESSPFQTPKVTKLKPVASPPLPDVTIEHLTSWLVMIIIIISRQTCEMVES